jgi:hypothetical protein
MEGEWIDLVIMGIAAALKDWINAQLSKFLAALGEWGALVLGIILYWKGGELHEKLKVFGSGLIVASVGQLARRYIPGIAPAPATAAAAPAPTAESYAMTYAAG